jgi:hypothetical protein
MNDVSKMIKAPAIGLITVGALNFALGLITLLSGLLRLTGIVPNDEMPADEAGRIGFFIGTFLGYGVAFIGLIIAPVIIYGAVQMMSGKSYKLAKTSAILAIIPFISCCFVIGIPFGIWALIVLNKPEVRAFFSGETHYQNYYPPMPPNF